MSSRIPYLDTLEADLVEAADRAARPAVVRGSRRRRPASSAWLRWSGAAAAVLVVAWVVGSVASNGGMFPASGDGATKFDQVGSAVGGPATDEGVPGFAAPSPAPPDALGNGDEHLGIDPSNDSWSAFEDADRAAADGRSETTPLDLAKIDRDGSLTLKIDEGTLRDRFAQVIAIAEANGGFLLSSETLGTGTARLTLRIPADRFDKAFVGVSRLGEIRASSVTGKDVTAEYIDYRAKLHILQGRREVIFSLYDQATTIPAVLGLESELNRVQLEMDQIQGQLRYLNAQTSISTLKVALSETEPDAEALSQGDERPDLGDAFGSATDGFLSVVSAMIVGLGYLIPIGIVAGIGFAVVMLVRRRDRGAS